MSKYLAGISALIISLLISPVFSAYAEEPVVREFANEAEFCEYYREQSLNSTVTPSQGQGLPLVVTCTNYTSDGFLLFSISFDVRENETFTLKNAKIDNQGSVYRGRFYISGSLTVEDSEIRTASNCLFALNPNSSSSNLLLKSGTFSTTSSEEPASPICLIDENSEFSEEEAFEKLLEFIPEDSIYLDTESETEVTETASTCLYQSKDAEVCTPVHVLKSTSVTIVPKGKGEEPEEPEEPTTPEEPVVPEEPTEEPENEPEIENPNTSASDASLYYVLFTTFSIVIFTTINRERKSSSR
ncbi:hypothetical protein IJ380_02480 [Candidatus Saccharibacteria bacterium]|nr:hypothetical protein [Candidatus Saccharibacteria bacterium]